MKTTKCFSLSLFIGLIISCYSSPTLSQKIELSFNDLNKVGNIISIKENSYSADGGASFGMSYDPLFSNTKKTFNNNNLVEEIEFDVAGKAYLKTTYSYNWQSISENKNSNGYITKTKYTWEKDVFGYITKELVFRDDALHHTITYIRDSQHHVVRKESEVSGKVLVTLYTYNTNGKLIEESSNNGSVYGPVITYQYDVNGNNIKKTMVFNNSSRAFENYKFDGHGNWIELTKTNEAGKISFITKRIIEYAK